LNVAREKDEMSRIEETFDGLRRARHAALMPYMTMGYPQRDSALSLVPAAVVAGADLIELGVPFSDPLADGATIQAASQQALANGMTLALCLEQAAAFRGGGVAVPLVLMSYYNPILHMGPDAFARQAAAAGIDGVIVPDLPPEELGALGPALEEQGIDPIFLLPPTADEERVRLVAWRSRGFLYLVSLVGVTGARDRLPPGLESFVARVRSVTGLPLAVGFGISTPQQAAQVARLADGVIVGSALVRTVGSAADPVAAAGAFIAALRVAMAKVP
jgi:tryptophan synthase alpha chain